MCFLYSVIHFYLYFCFQKQYVQISSQEKKILRLASNPDFCMDDLSVLVSLLISQFFACR